MKIPVAVKELQESSSSAQQEMLAEAELMATMHHKHLLPLLGVCLGHKLMLITPLMPLGNILDYMHQNSENLGSYALLLWATQIAEVRMGAVDGWMEGRMDGWKKG